MNLTELSTWQRIKRAICLTCSNYTWPDGYIELDIDQKAGVRRDDAEDVKKLLLDRYIARTTDSERFWFKVAGACFAMAALIYWLARGSQ